MLCSRTGCGKVNCTEHGRGAAPWAKQGKQPERLRGTSNQNRRKRWFAEHPFCVKCTAEGESRLATILDHIRALSEGGADEDSNLQGLCKTCHDAKTADESARGHAYR
jgi:5-methylcytosine-specific restriction protein A